LYLISPEFALKIYQLVSSEDNSDVDDMVLSVVSEFVATHISSQITQIDAVGKIPGLSYATPQGINESKAMIMFPQGEFVLTSYPLTLEGEAYTLWECLGGEAAEPISKALNGEDDSTAVLTPVDLNSTSAPNLMQNMAGMQQPMMGQPQMNMGMGMGMQQPMMGQPMMQQQMGMPNMGMQMNPMQMGGMPMGGAMPNMGAPNMAMVAPNVQPLQFPNLQPGLTGMEQGNIGLIMDVFMEMTVELGRTKKLIKDILGMGEGTIIELDKLAGEPVDILVNHKPIAKGEVVVIDENFGVRVTEILSPMERLQDSQ
jgi:flagellar motor switch protein FliN/FliY